MAEQTYQEGEQVEVFDVGKRRWLKAETLWLVRFDATDPTEEAWICELRNGNRGGFDADHMRKLA